MNKQTMHAGTKTGSGRRAALFAAQGAMVAALYVALTWIASIAGLSSMAIQVRISEALCVCPFSCRRRFPDCLWDACSPT